MVMYLSPPLAALFIQMHDWIQHQVISVEYSLVNQIGFQKVLIDCRLCIQIVRIVCDGGWKERQNGSYCEDFHCE